MKEEHVGAADLLRQVRIARAAVVAAQKRCEADSSRLRKSAADLERDAREELAAGREAGARRLLERRFAALGELADVDAQVESLRTRAESLAAHERALVAGLVGGG